VTILEVAIMSNYIWTEKQIRQGIGRAENKKDVSWLGVEVFRTPTRDSQGNQADKSDYRQLMKIIVKRGKAFDNEKNPDSSEYKISCKWDLKNQLLADSKPQKYFSPEVLANSIMGDLPNRPSLATVQKILGRPLTIQDQTIWIETKADWTIIYEALCSYQSNGKFKVGAYGNSLGDRMKWLMRRAEEVSCMYRVLKMGFLEIAQTTCCPYFEVPQYFLKFAYSSYDELFLAILSRQANFDFICRCLHPGSLTPLADSRHTAIIDNFSPVVSQLLQPVSENEDWSYIEQQVDNFRTASRLLKKSIPQRLQDLAYVVGPELSFYRNLLRNSQNPKILEAIQRWDEASSRASLGITKGLLRNQSKKPADLS
jgi:hypothetical protein